MSMIDGETSAEIIPVKLDDDLVIHIQATSLGGEERVGAGIPSFKEVTDAIEGIANAVVKTLKKTKPRSGSVEFGLEVGVESGKLTALLVKGTGTANLKITLEWGELTDTMLPNP
jgi:hypothetical protein